MLLDYFGARYYGSALGRFTSTDPENAGADASDSQSWNGYSYVRNTPLVDIDPDGLTDCMPSNGADFCVTHNDRLATPKDLPKGLNPLQEMEYELLFRAVRLVGLPHDLVNGAVDWLGEPRNGTCLWASTAAGASAGAGLGMLGLAGGPAVGITEPTAMAIGGGLGWAGGMVSCMSSTGTGAGQGGTEASGNSGKDTERKIKQFTRKPLSEQKAIYGNLKRTYMEDLQKYGQTAGNTSGETNRMERELEQMRAILRSRGQAVD